MSFLWRLHNTVIPLTVYGSPMSWKINAQTSLLVYAWRKKVTFPGQHAIIYIMMVNKIHATLWIWNECPVIIRTSHTVVLAPHLYIGVKLLLSFNPQSPSRSLTSSRFSLIKMSERAIFWPNFSSEHISALLHWDNLAVTNLGSLCLPPLCM